MTQEEKRKESYKTLTSELQALYASSESGAVLRAAFNMLQLPDTQYKTYVHLIGDTILGFYKTSELPGLLQKELSLSADDTQKIIQELTPFLEPVFQREKKEEEEKKKELSELQQSIASTKQENTTPPDIDTAKNPVVAPMRTMEADMNRIHGYGAYRSMFPNEHTEKREEGDTVIGVSQEDLLQEKQVLTDMPNYNEQSDTESGGDAQTETPT